jgi:hypothetical protein
MAKARGSKSSGRYEGKSDGKSEEKSKQIQSAAPARAVTASPNLAAKGQGRPAYEACQKPGHVEDVCWTKYPEKRPAWMLERDAVKEE